MTMYLSSTESFGQGLHDRREGGRRPVSRWGGGHVLAGWRRRHCLKAGGRLADERPKTRIGPSLERVRQGKFEDGDLAAGPLGDFARLQDF